MPRLRLGDLVVSRRGLIGAVEDVFMVAPVPGRSNAVEHVAFLVGARDNYRFCRSSSVAVVTATFAGLVKHEELSTG